MEEKRKGKTKSIKREEYNSPKFFLKNINKLF